VVGQKTRGRLEDVMPAVGIHHRHAPAERLERSVALERPEPAARPLVPRADARRVARTRRPLSNRRVVETVRVK